MLDIAKIIKMSSSSLLDFTLDYMEHFPAKL